MNSNLEATNIFQKIENITKYHFFKVEIKVCIFFCSVTNKFYHLLFLFFAGVKIVMFVVFVVK